MRLRGIVYRAHNPRWAFTPTSGEGAARLGGRFNPPGMPALYTSLRMETAWPEAQQGFPFKAQPLTICGYDIDCAEVADLTDQATCQELTVHPDDLACPWEDLAFRGHAPASWSLTPRLFGQGIAAIIVASFAPGSAAIDKNVVFWRWSGVLPYRVVVIDDEARLPRDDRSWG